MRLALISVLILAAVSPSAAAQERMRSTPGGTAALGGRITDRETGTPLAGVIVTLHADQLRAPLTAMTDTDGRFEFEALPPGGHRLLAAHPGYVQQFFDQRAVGAGAGMPVMLADKERRTDIDFVLARGGSLSGRILDRQGRPVSGARVAAIQQIGTRGIRMFRSGTRSTNLRGEYQLTNLPEGLFLVMARWTGPESKPIGPGLEQNTYYPGTGSMDDAVAIRVGRAEAVTNIDIPLAPVDLLRMSGQILRASSTGAIEAYLFSTGSSVRTVPIDRDGHFDITHLKPGRYTVAARAATDEGAEAVSLTVDLLGDATGLVLGLAASATLTGRIVMPDGTPVSGEGLQVAALLADAGRQVDPLPRDRVDVTADGSFTIGRLFGERLLQVSGLPEGWNVGRVMRDAIEVTSLHLNPGESVQVTIVLSSP